MTKTKTTSPRRIFPASPFHDGKTLLPEWQTQQDLRSKYRRRFESLARDLAKEGLDRNDLRAWAEAEIRMSLLLQELKVS